MRDRLHERKGRLQRGPFECWTAGAVAEAVRAAVVAGVCTVVASPSATSCLRWAAAAAAAAATARDLADGLSFFVPS